MTTPNTSETDLRRLRAQLRAQVLHEAAKVLLALHHDDDLITRLIEIADAQVADG